MESKSRKKCKIRKRGNLSTSSSSSLIQKYRFKRAILVGKRGGSSTSVPYWITSTKSPILAMSNSDQAKDSSVSARKLAATLWEINKVPSPSPTLNKDLQDVEENELRIKQKLSRPLHLSDPSYTPMSERMDRSKENGYRRKSSVMKKKLLLADYNMGGLDSISISNASLMEIETHTKSRSHTGGIDGARTRLKDVSNGITTSKELLKVLNRICGLDKQHSSGTSIVLAIQVELDRVSIQINQLIKEQRSNHSEIEFLIKSFKEEKAAWKSREHERIQNGIARIVEELEVEKKLRRQTERLNKKLGKELAETKASLSMVIKELESEKRAKEIIEQVCDELARGIGEDRAEVEQLMRESAKVREEVEKERQMLQLADVLREERVQMKLSEAKYQFEEKSAAVEKLRSELENYLQGKVTKENVDEAGSPSYENIKRLEAYLKEIKFGTCQNGKREEDAGTYTNEVVYDGDESADSDLHSIELNMDSRRGSFKWSFDSEGNALQNPQRLSVDKVFKGRNSIDNIQWTSISLHKRNTEDSDFGSKNHENANASDDIRLVSESDLHSQTHNHEEEINNDKLVQSLRDR